jgi:mannose-6-phosphate isomerase
MNDVYPLQIEPRSVPIIWGGTALAERFGKQTPSGATNIAESWECYEENAVRNGSFAGTTLHDVREQLGAALLGKDADAPIFPILTKLIDARDTLSVQVHPDDAYAIRAEHQPNGKTECWYVLEAEPGATIVLGWNRDTSREEYERRVADGTLGELLRRVRAEPGDVFYLPAGTVHAIGAGIVLFEAQQTSDLTYRIFDWNRTGPDGSKRELHVQKAADVLNYRRGVSDTIEPLQYVVDGSVRTVLVAGSSISLERILITGGVTATIATEGVPLALMPLAHPVELFDPQGNRTEVAAYETFVIPAALEKVSVRAFAEATALLVASPPSGTLPKRLAEAGIAQGHVTAFLSQF